MVKNVNLEVLRVENAKDVKENFFFNSECGAFQFMDKDYNGAVEITRSGAKELGENWTRMFEGTKVSKVIANDTSNVKEMRGMFWKSEATSIDLSSFDTSNVSDMSYMFCESSAISLDLSSFDTSNTTDMRGMFWKSKATSIDLSSFDTSNVTDMSYMFNESQATSLDLSSFDTSNVTNMSGMFWRSNATSIDLSSFNTSNVTDMDYIFRESQVTSLDLRSFDISNVESMDLIFDGSNIKEILVRTESDTNRFQDSSDIALNLVFNPNIFNKKDVPVESEDADTIDKLVELVLKNVREEEISIDDGIEMLKHLFSTKTV